MADENKDGIDDTVDEVSYNAVKERIANFDFDRLSKLMGIAQGIIPTFPKCTAIFGLVQAAVEEMNVEAQDIARQRKDEAEKEMAKRAQEAEEERKRQSDENTDVVHPEGESDDAPDRDEAERRAALRSAAMGRQTGGTPNPPEKPDPTPGQPRPDLNRPRPAAPNNPDAPRRL